MAKRNITYLSETNLITCVLQTGLAEGVLDAAKNCGAQGATISLARGTGIRERMGLMGVAIDEQKEVIRIIVSDEQANRVFDAMYLAGKLDTPGKGIMFMTKLDRVATYIPQDVLKNIAQVDQKNAS
ncbi:MAG: P-II family nitrogen regulator [Pseudomonadota bacterium]|nr:P-II family nitrogen regulator [Pseudomonadota bacterium]